MDFDVTTSPVVSREFSRLITSLATNFNLEHIQFDFKNAYLNAENDVTTYVYPPEGYGELNKQNMKNQILEVVKSLYGEKQSGYLWYKVLVDKLKDKGFTQMLTEPCLFYINDGTFLAIVIIYVDDGLAFTNNVKRLKTIIDSIDMEKKYLQDDHFVGLKINRNDKFVECDQITYIEKLAERFNVTTGCKRPFVKKLNKIDKTTSNKNFNEIIGSLQYLANGARPDIAFWTNSLSQHLTAYSDEHYDYAINVLKYVYGTKNLVLKANNGKIKIDAYCDASYNSEYDGKSRTGLIIMVNDMPVVWFSKKQSVVALSTAEAEYMAYCMGCRYLRWVHNIVHQIFGIKLKSELKIDNTSAKAIAENLSGTKLARHIAVRFHYVKEVLQDGDVVLKYCNTKDMLADMFTKTLDNKTFERHRSSMLTIGGCDR